MASNWLFRLDDGAVESVDWRGSVDPQSPAGSAAWVVGARCLPIDPLFPTSFDVPR